MSGQTFSTFTEVGMIDARLKTGIITLPTTTSIPYRILTLKDVYGATSFSTVTISTQTGDAFEDGTTTRSINAAWGMTTLYAGKAGTWYTIGGSVLTTASISSLTISSIFGLNNLVSTSYLATQLGSTVIGLGTTGYLSSIPSLGGFVSTANLANLVSTANLVNLVSTANLAGLVSTSYLTTQIGSTIIGLGTVGYISTVNLANLVSTANLANHVSTANLANLISTANLANHVSTANLANFVSTANLANLVSTTYLATQLGSTVRGLGTAGYLSSINYSTVVLSSLTAQNLTSVQGYISSLTVDSLFLGSNSAFVDMGDVIATSLSTIQINVGTQFAVSISAQQLFVSSIQATNIIGALTNANLTSTVIGLGTAGYISTGLGGFSFVSTANLANLVSTANLANHISTANLANLVSTANLANLVSTANLANLVSTANLANLVSTTYLATQLGSTVIGLGTAGYLSTIIFGPIVSTHNLANLVSTANLANLVSTANLVNLVSTANLANLVSTSYLQTQLGSTVIGLGTAGYISSSQLLSTSAGLNQYINSFIDPVELTSTVIGLGTAGFVSSLGLTYAVASTAQGLGTFGYTSTSQLLSTSLGLYQEIQNSPANIKQSNVTSTIIGLGTFGYLSTVVFGSVVSTANLANLVSTANLTNLVSTANLVNFVSTANIANLVSTTYLATQLGSTVRGLGTAGYLSSINYSTVVLSSLTAQNLTSVQGYISSLVVDSLQLGSNTAYIYMGDVIATSLSTVYVAAGSATIISLSAQQLYVSSIQATNIIGALTTANLTSTVIGLGTVGYISTGLGGFSFVSTANLANLVSTANLANLVSTANLANHVSTANLANLVSTANLANFISTANLANFVSTANLANLVSTTYLATQLGSTVIGLGTAGYISSAQLLSTTFGYSQNFTTQNASISSLRFSTATANNAYISSLNIDQLTFGDGNGWADFGVLRALAISTLVVNTGILYATTVSTSQLVGVSFLVQSNLTSTVIGLGTAGYLSSVTAANLANLVSTANLTNLVSTANLVNLVSTANLANLVSTANLANLLSTANLVNLVSTANLVNLVSTANLANLVSTANLVNLVSTANLANLVSTANLANFVSTTYLATQLNSTVRGLGTSGYISTINYSTVVLSSLTAQNLTSVQGYISSLTVDAFYLGSNTAFFNMGDVIATSLSTIQINVGTQFAVSISAQQLYVSSIQATNIIGALVGGNLTSTVIGLGSAGYISSSQLLSTSAGLSQYISSFIDPTELTSTVIGLGTQGFVSSLGLTYAVASTAQGLGTFGYTSTSQLLSTSLGLYQEIQNSPTNIKQSNVTSTIIGLGTFGYLSTVVFGSIVSTANLAGHVSTANLANLVSTANLVNLVSTANLANLVSTANLAGHISTANLANLVSTSYLSTQLGSTFAVLNVSSFSTFSFTGTTGFMSTLTVNNLFIGSNQGFTTMGDVIGTSLSTILLYTGVEYATNIYASSLAVSSIQSYSNQMNILSAQQLYVSSIQATNIIGALTTANLTSTVIGLGTAGYISSIPSIGGFVSTANLANLVSTANLANLVSTANLANLVSTANLANLVSTANLANLVSTANLANLVSTANLGNLVSTANLANLVSTSYLATQIGSTVIGLGTAGYVSSSQLLSTSFGLNLFISTFYVDHPELLSTVAGLGTLGYLSTGFSTSISRNFLTSSLSTVNINTANVNSLTATISSLTVNALFIGTGTGFTDTGDTIGTSMSTITITANSITAITLSTQQLNVSSITGISLISQTNLTSTVIGLGTTGYVSSSQLVSTSAGLSQYISSFIDPTELTSTVIGLGTAGFVSSLGLTYAVASTAQGLGTFGYTSTSQLLSTSLGLYQEIQNSPVNIKQSNVTSTIIGLGTFGYLSTVVFGSIISTANLANLVSTANLANLVSTANLANLVSTANLANHISTANLANLVSTANLANHISTANLANFVSTTYLSTQLGSTFATLNVSSLSTFSLQGTTAFISSLTVNGLFIGSNQGFVNMGDVIATSVSSLVVYAGGMFSTSNSSQQTFLSSINGVSFANIGSGGIAGIPSSLNTSSISTFSLTGTTAFISSLTVNGLFIGSNQGFVNMGDIIATSLSSLVIYTGSAFATSNQASITSTQQLNISSINGQTFGGPITSTVIGLGTTGYLSTIVFGSIVSTANLANHISTANLANLVSTANLANHISTANLANHISTANLANLVSTTYIATQLGSTVIGLGTVGYISSAQFLSSFNGISLNFRTSSINTNNLSAGTTYVSSMVINTLQIGTTPGFIQMGDIITTSVSTILTTTNLLNAGINAISSFNVYGGTNQSGLGLRFFGSSIQSPLGQPASMSVSSVSTYTTMYLGTFDQYALGRGASLGFGANNINGLQTLQGRITGTPTTNTVSGGNQGTLNFEVNDSGRMFNTMTMWAVGGQGRVGINCNSPSFNFDLNGTMRVTSTTTFSSNLLLTGGLTSFMSNSGLFSNVGTTTFASNVLHTGGLTTFMSNSGLFSNVGQATFTGGVNIVASALTASNSSSPVIFSNATSAANSVVKCEMTGANFIIRQSANASAIAVIENTGGGGMLLNPLGTGNVGIGSSNISFPLDVFGAARSGIPISSLTGIAATFANSSYGIYYYITNSAFATINLVGGAPSPAAGWYVTLRNNTGSYLSCTITGAVSSTPASPVTIPPSNSVTIAYDSATSLYVLF